MYVYVIVITAQKTQLAVPVVRLRYQLSAAVW